MAHRICRFGALLGAATLGLCGASAAQTAPVVPGVAWPGRPVMSSEPYPDCVDDYTHAASDFDRQESAKRCKQKLEHFNTFVLNGFAQDTDDYLGGLLRLDARVRAMHLPLALALDARNYVIAEQNAYRRDNGHHVFGRQMRDYYALYDRYRTDTGELCRIRNHFSMRQETCS